MRREVFLFVVLLLSCTLVSAKISISNEHLERSYSGGSSLRGTFQLSLTNHPADTRITSNVLGSVRLLDLLRQQGLQEGSDYTCSSSGCDTSYRAYQTLSSIGSGTTLFGFNVSKSDVSLQDVKLTLTGSSNPSCTPPFIITIGDHILSSNAYRADMLCGIRAYGCFNPDLNADQYTRVKISNQGLCERVRLNAAPAYMLGARVSNTTNGVGSSLTLNLYTNDSTLLDGCTLPGLHQQTEELTCVMNTSLADAGDYYLCIAVSNDNSDYGIRTEEQGSICGTGILGEAFSVDYELFALRLGYDGFSSMNISQAYEARYDQSLTEYFDEYLAEQYNRVCTGGCFLPFSLNTSSGGLEVQNAQIRFTSSGNTYTDTKVYSGKEQPGTINANATLIRAEQLPFTFPQTGNVSSFTLLADGTLLLTVPVTFSQGLQARLFPTSYATGVPTTFVVTSPYNITSTTWNFGDGQPQTVQGSAIKHVLHSSTNVSVSVTVIGIGGAQSVLTQTLTAVNLNESARVLVSTFSQALTSLRSSIQALPSTTQNTVAQYVNLSVYEQALQVAQQQLMSSNESVLSDIITSLSSLAVPQRVFISNTITSPLDVGYKTLDPSYATVIYNISLPPEKIEDIRLGIIDWITQHYTTQARVQTLSVQSLTGETISIATLYSLSLQSIQGNEKGFLVVDYPLASLGTPLKDETHIGTLFQIPDTGLISFSLTESSLASLGMFIMPPASFFDAYKTYTSEKRPFPTGLLIFFIILLVSGLLGGYIFLQEWYKRSYQQQLFPRIDDLYNVIYFVYTSRINGLAEQDIVTKLRQQKWSGEHIRYAVRKLDGKRTGMWEIPFFLKKEQLKVHEELTKRHVRRDDGRFIKRPF